jgi:SAM-dependent methyltransferase
MWISVENELQFSIRVEELEGWPKNFFRPETMVPWFKNIAKEVMDKHMVYTRSNVDRFFWLKHSKRQLIIYCQGRRRQRDKTLVIEQYSKSGSRDLDYYFDENLKRDSMVNGRIGIVPQKVVRDIHIAVISKYITKNKPRRVLEIGAGTSINSFLLTQLHPDVEFFGIDLVPERVETGLKYFEENHGFVPNTIVGDAMNLPFNDSEFEMVYTMHCFEQMENYIGDCVREARRVCTGDLVFLEPDWKSSNIAQKLFLLNNDYLRNINGVLECSGQSFDHVELTTYHNPLNRTGLFRVFSSR